MSSFGKGFRDFGAFRRRQQHIPWGAVDTSAFLVYEDFSRSDNASSLGSPLKGAAWSPVTGTWGVSAHSGYCATATSNALATTDTGASDYDVTVVCTSNDYINNPFGIVLRAIDTSNYLVLFSSNLVTGNLTCSLRKRDVGVLGALTSHSLIPGANGAPITIRLICRGNVITPFFNGVAGNGGATTLAGADATKFGSGQSSKIGFASVGTANTGTKYSLLTALP